MKRRTLVKGMALVLPSMWINQVFGKPYSFSALSDTSSGPFTASWESLSKYVVPDWFRDAKFGIWAHWGPQCQPERGDWYARGMYQEGSDQYRYHCKKYGHPSKFGFKDVINEWKAENWNPEELVALYKKAGARYFMALANHHDNFDLYNSSHQPWNSTKLGPKKDIIAGWAKAAKQNDLHFGVSVHAAHTWSWYETSQRWDKKGPYAEIPYDGNLTKKQGKDKWWDGYDPQDLYAQNHPMSENSWDNGMIHKQWDWGNGVVKPSDAYCEKFYKRTKELIDRYEPELVYFDDTALPLWPISDAGLRIAAHMYNKSIKRNGQLEAVICGKILSQQQRQCMVWDIERGQSNQIEPLPWQTDTCIGAWHYDRRIYEKNRYKSAKTVIHTMIDVVSKNGNLMLNIPVRGDGTIDEKERAVVEEIGEWMKINSEGIYGSRPWVDYGEGPSTENTIPLSAQGFNEGKGNPFGAQDIRFTKKGTTLYAFFMEYPDSRIAVSKKLGVKGVGEIKNISLLGSGAALKFEQNGEVLKVDLPDINLRHLPYTLKIEGAIV
ncbi:alpha-L-fucosidase [Pelobium manganitolerans]|uniref:alpha-L-fucosidase n=1 Tax=Pelobium manganitolerans TaxID=1842495 RepID=UPI003FA369E7